MDEPTNSMAHLGPCTVTVTMPVAWGEMDAYGHVNNAVYFRYFESARVEYFDEIGFAGELDLDRPGPILASTQARFFRPLRHPDQVRVGARTLRLGRDRFEMEYRVFSERHEGIVANGLGIVVCYDYRRREKMDLPGRIAERIRELDGPAPWR